MTAYVFKRKRPPVLQYTGDYTKVGSPTITDNVVSGFSASNYLITKSVFNPLDADFEFVFKINLTSHAINVILAENRTGQFSKVYLCIGKDQKVFFGIGTGSAWRIRVYSNVLLELNTDYWIKIVKSNGTFYIYYSLDGRDYILDNSVADTSVFPSITVEGRIGCWKDSSSGTSYFHGSIDLTESYIKLNGEYWWRGAKYVNADKAYVFKQKGNVEYWNNELEYATAGTYTFELTEDTNVKVVLVGGGGGGGLVWSSHAAGSGGGSGACVKAIVKLSAGTYTVTNGAKDPAGTGGKAGDSTLSLGDTVLITAGGGYGGGDAGGAVGVGGTFSIADSIEVVKILYTSNGNNGGQGSLVVTGAAGQSVGRIQNYPNAGAGGNGQAQAGTDGYVLIDVTADETDYDYLVDYNKAYVLKRKEYWKYGTEPNVTVVGSPTIDNGVVSGFSASNYLTTTDSFSPQGNYWEMVFVFTTCENTSATQVLVDSNNGLSYRPVGLYIANSKMKIVLSSSTSSNNIVNDFEGTKTINPNTKYYYKLEFDGSSYTGSVSLDGLLWETDAVINSSVSVLSGYPFILGEHTNKTYSQPFKGSIDLTQSYIKINNKLWWKGVKAVKATKDDYDFTTD